MILSNPHVDPRKTSSSFRRENCRTERLRNWLRVIQPASSRSEISSRRVLARALLLPPHSTSPCATKGLSRSHRFYAAAVWVTTRCQVLGWVPKNINSQPQACNSRPSCNCPGKFLISQPVLPSPHSSQQGQLPTLYARFPTAFLPACMVCPSLPIFSPVFCFPLRCILETSPI